MKIEIKNFGPIDYLEFDLEKDLHFIYGQNSIGKSYATYCIYCLLKNLKIVTESKTNYYKFDNNYEDSIKKLFKNLTTKKPIDITLQFINIVEKDLKNTIIQSFSNSILNTFASISNLRNKYSNKNFEIIIKYSNDDKLILFSNEKNEINLKLLIEEAKIEIHEKNTKTTKFSLFLNGLRGYSSANIDDFIFEFKYYKNAFVDMILKELINDFRNIYYLPASRSGLYQALNAFSPMIAELSQNRFFMKNKKIELPSLSEPLSDYFLNLSTIDNKKLNKKFNKIIDIIQKEILKGEISYNDKTNKIIYKPNNINLELNLSESSSMVSELSPIVLFLKHIIKNKSQPELNELFGVNIFYNDIYENKYKNSRFDIMFIEEPEAHLHPDIQIKLMEVFANLIGYKLKIFITSHSNFMFNELNNLIIKKELDVNKVEGYHLIQGENGTYKNPNVPTTEDGIDDENFIQASEKLYNERMEYLENN